jgi:hypothetical protein
MSLGWLDGEYQRLGHVDNNFIPTPDDFNVLLNNLSALSIIVAKMVNQRWRQTGREHSESVGAPDAVRKEKTTLLCRSLTDVQATQKLAVELKKIMNERQDTLDAMNSDE